MKKSIEYKKPFFKEVSEHLFQILNKSQNGITITDPNQNDNPIVFANKAFCNTFGYSLDEIINKNCRFLHKYNTNQQEIIDIKKSITNKESITTILRNYKKDGTEVFIELLISPIFDENKNLKYFLGIQKDITKDKRFVEQMKISQSLANIGSWEFNVLTNELYWSDEIFKLFELDKSNFSPSYEAFLNVIHPQDRKLVNDAYLESLKTKEQYSIQHRLLMNDGRIKYVEEKCISYFDKNGNPIKSVGTVQDISDIKKIEIELQKILSFFESHKLAMDKSSIVSKCDLKGIITYVNDNFCKISGFSKEEVIGKPHNIIRHPDNPNELFEDLWNTIKNKNVWKKTLRNRDKVGKEYWVDTSILPILDENDNIVEYIAVRHDVTKMIQQQIELDNIANTDTLTGLGNRYKLLNDIKNSTNPALAILNIDNFSQINDFYGHEIGDIVIKEFAIKIKNELISEEINIYHIQADEYVIFKNNVNKDKFLEIIINLSKKIEKNKIIIGDDYLTFNFTVAISFENKDSLLKTADMALKIAKNSNKEFIIYKEEISLNKQYENNIKWTKKIKNSIENDLFIPVFQPIVNNKTMLWEKYESLVRIQDEENKLISPFFFLEIAKKTKYYTNITKIMIEKTFKSFNNKHSEFSINLTVDDILNNDIKEFIFYMLKIYNVGSRVVFEIVESESIENFEEVCSFIKNVKLFGCKIAIDDFGTGYSNFQYLVKLNADYIKIDGSLIKDIDKNKISEIVCKNIVNFAKDLNIKTIAEFVENESIFNKVKELGIDYSQGYYFSKPQLNIEL